MSLLCDKEWKLKYTPDDGELVTVLYVSAFECATRYDQLTGYFRARALALAVRGIEGLVRNSGRMRLLVGCTLDQPETDASPSFPVPAAEATPLELDGANISSLLKTTGNRPQAGTSP